MTRNGKSLKKMKTDPFLEIYQFRLFNFPTGSMKRTLYRLDTRIAVSENTRLA